MFLPGRGLYMLNRGRGIAQHFQIRLLSSSLKCDCFILAYNEMDDDIDDNDDGNEDDDGS